MYMAIIYGYNEMAAFSEDKEKAKQLVIKRKKAFCKDDLTKWNWDTVSEFYGASVIEITNDTSVDL